MSLRHAFPMGCIAPKGAKLGSWEGGEKNLSYDNGGGPPKSRTIRERYRMSEGLKFPRERAIRR